MFARAAIVFLAFLKFLFLANRFGASENTDAYFVSFGVTFLIIMGVGGTFYSTFTPLFIEYKEKKGEKEALSMARSAFSLLILIFLVLSTALYVLAPYIILVLAPGFTQQTLLVSSKLLRFFSPAVFISAPIILLASIYNSYQRFALPAFTSILPMAGALLALLFFSEEFGITALPLGIISFLFIQLLCLVVGLGYKAKQLFNISLFLHPGVKELLRLAIPMFLALTILDVNLMVDRFFASLLGVGYVSSLAYGGRVAVLSSTLLTVPFVMSMFPYISNHATHNEKDAISKAVLKGVRIFALILIPWSALLIAFGDEIIEAIFQHGAFSHEATSLTAHALLFYSFGILFYGLNPLLRMVFFAFKDSLNLLKVSLVGFFANLLLDFMLIKFLGLGGIALATSLVTMIMTSYLFLLLRHKLGRPLTKAVFNEIAKPLGAAVSTFIILKLVHSTLMQSHGWDGLFSLVLLLMIGIAVYTCFYSILKQKLQNPL